MSRESLQADANRLLVRLWGYWGCLWADVTAPVKLQRQLDTAEVPPVETHQHLGTFICVSRGFGLWCETWYIFVLRRIKAAKVVNKLDVMLWNHVASLNLVHASSLWGCHSGKTPTKRLNGSKICLFLLVGKHYAFWPLQQFVCLVGRKGVSQTSVKYFHLQFGKNSEFRFSLYSQNAWKLTSVTF